MTILRLSTCADLLGVSDDTVRRWVDKGRLAATTDEAGRVVIEGAELAAFAEQRWAEERDQSSSARNSLTGLVTHLLSDPVMSQVTLQCGPHRVTALISTEAVRDLDLVVGSIAVAKIKATHVIVELPSGSGQSA